ncbi:MAG: tripartite tricarboxylate transporter TctB family protein [Treponema sp.]|nr:tripartite tricarboxylate transporter TctB family protein [Treponema sp.]
MTLSVLSSLFVTLVGIVYTVATFLLPEAALGRPNEPKIFPAILGILLCVLGFILLAKEFYAQKKSNEKNVKYSFGQSERQIAFTLLNGVLYAILFAPIGYVFSTIIFVLIELFIFDGFKIWKKGLLISVIFSLIIYIIFDRMLGIILPRSPLGFI